MSNGVPILKINAKKHSPSPSQTQVMRKFDDIQYVTIGTSTVPVAVIHDRSPYQNGGALLLYSIYTKFCSIVRTYYTIKKWFVK